MLDSKKFSILAKELNKFSGNVTNYSRSSFGLRPRGYGSAVIYKIDKDRGILFLLTNRHVITREEKQLIEKNKKNLEKRNYIKELTFYQDITLNFLDKNIKNSNIKGEPIGFSKDIDIDSIFESSNVIVIHSQNISKKNTLYLESVCHPRINPG